MYKIVGKTQNEEYDVLDSVDNVVDRVPSDLFETFLGVGFTIEGVSSVGDEIIFEDVDELDEYEDIEEEEFEEEPEEEDSYEEEEEYEDDEDYDYEEGDEVNVENMYEYIPQGVRAIIKAYYKWYTVQIYKSFAEDIGLQVSVNKAIELEKLRGNHIWEFGGINDTEIFGNSMCELGHPLRYEFYAINESGETIVFGEKCSSDFFNISEENMRKLSNIRKDMCSEVLYIARKLYSDERDYKDVALLYDVVDRLDDNGLYKNMMRGYLGLYFRKFVENGIPLPKSMVKSVRRMLNTPKSVNEDGLYINNLKSKYLDLLLNLYPEKQEIIKEVTSSCKGVNNYLNKYFEFLFNNRLDGKYAYNPITKVGREEGSFNKKAVTHYRMLLGYIERYVGCSKFTLAELDSVVEDLEIYRDFFNLVELYPYSERLGIREGLRKEERKDLSTIVDNILSDRFSHIKDSDLEGFKLWLKNFKASTDYKTEETKSSPERVTSVNNRYTLQERPDIKRVVDNILSKSERITLATNSTIISDIAETVSKNGWFSDKQLIYLNKGQNLLQATEG